MHLDLSVFISMLFSSTYFDKILNIKPKPSTVSERRGTSSAQIIYLCIHGKSVKNKLKSDVLHKKPCTTSICDKSVTYSHAHHNTTIIICIGRLQIVKKCPTWTKVNFLKIYKIRQGGCTPHADWVKDTSSLKPPIIRWAPSWAPCEKWRNHRHRFIRNNIEKV